MGRTPRSYHGMAEAGLHTEDAAKKERARRHFQVVDTVKEHRNHKTKNCDQHSPDLPSPFCRDSDQRGENDYCGLSSLELSKVFNPHHRRSRKHTMQLTDCIDHCASVASEPISEGSAQFHLGHRDHVKDKRLELLQEQQERLAKAGIAEESTAGVASANLNKKGNLGAGRRKFHNCKSDAHVDHGHGLDAFGGEEVRFLEKRKTPREDQLDHIFNDQLKPDPERRKKKFFDNHVDKAAHATEDCPVGVSTQIDLDSRGFLGRSKGRSCTDYTHLSSDPVSHKPDEPRSPGDLSCYGMNSCGKRKFLVQTNLDSGCRHRNAPEIKAAPTLCVDPHSPILERELPPNSTPYYQDDLPERERAKKCEASPTCKGSTEADRKQNPRQHKEEHTHTWSVFNWTPHAVDKMDKESAASFVGSTPEKMSPIRHLCDEEIKETEFRGHMGATKRSFGNAHNMSDFRFDYADDPSFHAEHVSPDGKFKWGAGHGRKKFNVVDHVSPHYTDSTGVQKYTSKDGDALRSKQRIVPPFMDKSTRKADAEGFMLDDDGNAHMDTSLFKSKSTALIYKDTVSGMMKDDVQSEDSNTLAVVGCRRKNKELLRPQSARRFPEKDGQKVRPRSANPRAPSNAGIPLHERAGWKK